MTRAEAWALHAAALAVGATGLGYGWTRYFAEPADELAVVNHPWQPQLQALHVLASPLLVFLVALVWREHVWARLRGGFPLRRRTGLLLTLLFAPGAASGYLLQVSVEERWRTLWAWVHGVASTLWILLYLVHQLGPRPPRPEDFADPG